MEDIVLSGKDVLLITDRDGPVQKAAEKGRAGHALVGVATADRMRLLKALGDDRVDFVLPDLERLRIDKSVAVLSKRNGCAVALSHSALLNSQGIQGAIRRAAEAIEVLEYYNAEVLFATFAKEELEIRSGKDLEAVLLFLGAKDPARWLSAAGKIIERNGRRAGKIAPGVAEA